MIRKLAVAAVLTALAVPAFADDCAVTIEGTDQMTYNLSEIDVKKAVKNSQLTSSTSVSYRSVAWGITGC